MRTRTLPQPPVFRRLKQACPDPPIPVVAPYRDLGDMAVSQLPVHCVRRLLEAGVYESNDLSPSSATSVIASPAAATDAGEPHGSEPFVSADGIE